MLGLLNDVFFFIVKMFVYAITEKIKWTDLQVYINIVSNVCDIMKLIQNLSIKY